MTAAFVAALSLVIGLAAGSSPRRSISTGLYAVGAMLVVVGFFQGNRGPVRMGGGAAWIFDRTLLRWATRSEHEENLSLSALFVLLGFTLIAGGALLDGRYQLL
jgi:Kef-type K+ transport system membrane component KefB